MISLIKNFSILNKASFKSRSILYGIDKIKRTNIRYFATDIGNEDKYFELKKICELLGSTVSNSLLNQKI